MHYTFTMEFSYKFSHLFGKFRSNKIFYGNSIDILHLELEILYIIDNRRRNPATPGFRNQTGFCPVSFGPDPLINLFMPVSFRDSFLNKYFLSFRPIFQVNNSFGPVIKRFPDLEWSFRRNFRDLFHLFFSYPGHFHVISAETRVYAGFFKGKSISRFIHQKPGICDHCPVISHEAFFGHIELCASGFAHII